jgi:hypothetical protein
MAREKSGVSGDRIKNDPAFERTRENLAEFGRAGQASKVLRSAFRALTRGKSDSRMASRLTQEMMKVVHADGTNDRGKRNVLDGELALLQGFQFNQFGPLDQTLLAGYEATIDRAAGLLTVTIPSFNIVDNVVAPEGATHFLFKVGGAEVDFEARTHVANVTSSAPIPLDGPPQPELSLVVNLTAGSTRPMFLAFGIDFVQMMNGKPYSLKSGQYNALALVMVDGGV